MPIGVVAIVCVHIGKSMFTHVCRRKHIRTHIYYTHSLNTVMLHYPLYLYLYHQTISNSNSRSHQFSSSSLFTTATRYWRFLSMSSVFLPVSRVICTFHPFFFFVLQPTKKKSTTNEYQQMDCLWSPLNVTYTHTHARI